MSEISSSNPNESFSGPPLVDLELVQRKTAERKVRKGKKLHNRAREIDTLGPDARKTHKEELDSIREQIANL
jgi:hypothetical protein